MTTDHDTFLREALALARGNLDGARGGPFGAVVVKDGQIIGRAANAVLAGHDPTAHAEVEAIRDACRRLGTHDLSGAVIYASSEPCPMCLGAILWARIGAVFYAASTDDATRVGFDDAAFYDELARPLGARRLPLTRRLPDEGRALFDAWLEAPGRGIY